MAEYLSAGVFIQEVASSEQVIQGVSTSTFATVGWLPRGPTNVATLVGSLTEYFTNFGGYWGNSTVPLAVTAFFKNNGTRAYIVRVVPTDALPATVSVPTNEWTLNAYSPGTWGNLVQVVIQGNSNYYNNATATYTKFDILIQEESAPGVGDYSTVETFTEVVLDNPDDPSYFPLVLNDSENGSKEIQVVQVSGGIPEAFESTAVSGETLAVGDGSTQTYNYTVAQPAIAPFTLEIFDDGELVASDNGRGVIVAEAGVSGYTGVSGTVNYTTGAIAVTFTPATLAGHNLSLNYYKAGVKSVSYQLASGTDGTSVDVNQVTSPILQAKHQGLFAFDLIDEFLNIGLPDFRGNEIAHDALISYCEDRGDCFAIIDTAQGADSTDAVNYKRITLNSLSSYAAMYWPGIKVSDPAKNSRPTIISPVGHVAGVYARTDTNRNVGKAPAGTQDGALTFLISLEKNTSQSDRDLVYPAGINPLIASAQTGTAVWGTRTLQVTGDFTLVNVRRLFIFLEKSVYNSTFDLVFEPIGDDLFTKVNLRLTGFLTNLTLEGYFASRTPAQAFQVTVDDTNNTPATIAARQLITDILIAPQTPAEFVVFRFQRSLNAIGT